MAAPFVIPVARNPHGRLVLPDEARRGAAYVCPQCAGPVDLHAGERKRRHFHHRAGASSCSTESIAHLSAKRLVVQAVEAWLAGERDAPTVVRRCAHAECAASAEQRLPKKVEEHRLPTGHVADVALLARAGEIAVAAIEILHSHAVDERKAFELGIPWIEVDAAQVCADAGRVLVPVRDRFIPWLCPAHASTRGDAHARQREDRARIAAVLRTAGYKLADYRRDVLERSRRPRVLVDRNLAPRSATATRRRRRARSRSDLSPRRGLERAPSVAPLFRERLSVVRRTRRRRVIGEARQRKRN
jgi:hypothetical protein